jgi:hypothetical protein
MDASDIVKKKQLETICGTFSIQPIVRSTTYPISSIQGGNSSYGTEQHVSFPIPNMTMTYETINQIRPLQCEPFKEEWKAIDTTPFRTYQSIYGGLSTTSTVNVNSTFIRTAPTCIKPFVTFHQGNE